MIWDEIWDEICFGKQDGNQDGIWTINSKPQNSN